MRGCASMYSLGFGFGLSGMGLSENGLPVLGLIVTLVGLAIAVLLVAATVRSAQRYNAEMERALRARFKDSRSVIN